MASSIGWKAVMRHYREQLLACDYFVAEFQAEDFNIVRTPHRAPNANAFSERRVRAVRQECLDRILILNQRHLRQVLDNFLDYYNTRRSYQSLDRQSPVERPQSERTGLIQKREILGGIVNDYYWVPAQTSVQLA